MADRDRTAVEALLASVRVGLAGPRHALADAAAHVADGAGLYAIHGDPESWLHLGLGEMPAKAALYVGKADQALVSRELQTHFLTGRTGQSALRRTFAALLRDHLGLRGVPRNQTKPERLAEYALSDEHDALLTSWMHAHLAIAVWPEPEDCTSLGALEIEVLKRWSPPLNLRDTRSTWGARVSATQKQMASDARTWARDHGHKL